MISSVMNLKKIQIVSVIALFGILSSVLSPRRVFAQASDSVTTKVGINICGNLIVEVPAEDCEGVDLNGQSCESLGFQSGTLSCDISCSFETALCVPFPPPSCGDGNIDAGEECEMGDPVGRLCDWSSCDHTSCECIPEEEEDTDITLVPLDEKYKILYDEETSEVDYVNPLPLIIQYLDPNDDGSLRSYETEAIVEFWVNLWRGIVEDREEGATCDLNDDGVCDIFDFSTLLYYFEL